MKTDTLGFRLMTLARWLEYPAATEALERFASGMAALTQDQREELYTATFDVSPACVLYVSIHLFGEENFKRGEFMAALHARYQSAGFSPKGELPDHLSVLLRFAAQTDEAERRELVEFCLLGPVGKMIAALGEANPYRSVLEAVRDTLTTAYPGIKPAMSPIEQMRQHGATCPTVSSGCGCGAARIQDGPGDETEPAPTAEPAGAAFGRVTTF
jgi:nitrate reductase delta subunit